MMDAEEILNFYLSRFKNDLWIERRLKCDEIIEHLQQLERVQKKPLDCIINDLIKFFKFLKEQCSGQGFNDDKQWSELMNLMKISRKLNHKSVKLKDIVKNKELIEADAERIRKLNEKVKLCNNIEFMLNDLNSMIQGSSIELPASISNDDSLPFILNQVLQIKNYIQDRCKPLLYTLKLEIDSELIASEANLQEIWSIKIQNLSCVLEKLDCFSNNFHEFQSKLLNLKPLMSIEENNVKVSTNSLSLCKIKFKSIQEVNRKLLESLSSLRSKKSSVTKKGLVDNRKLMMVNLLSSSSKNMIKFVDELYDSLLTKALLDLDKCRKELDRIMMNLRIEFGRFYFVSDIELLTIIALDSRLIETEYQSVKSTNKITNVDKQSLISKLFNNSIDGFIIDDNKFIVGVKSPLNEVILIQDDPIPIKKKLNIYSTEIVRILNECSRKLRNTLKILLIKSLDDKRKEHDVDWSLPVQLMNVAENIKFCRKIEAELDQTGDITSFDSLLKFYERRFEQLCDSKASNTVKTIGNSSLDGLKKSAAISLTVNYISTIVKLKSNKVTSRRDWNWIKQIRYYYMNDNDNDQYVEVEIANAKFRYRFDYLPIHLDNSASNNSITFKRLINTQITDKCIHVASQSIYNFRLGANPYGPAGSGKTETIKALGHSLGCQVIVHNCTESNDSSSLEKLIFGLAHTGLWGCFDEFNRLSSSVLSTVSAALELVQINLRENKTTIELANGEQMMSIDRDSAFFVTLNPGDETKYRGRRKLPANLRNLFLPISMIRVEIGSIVSENLLILSWKLNLVVTDNYNQSEILLKSGHKFHLFIEWLRENVGRTSGRCEWDLRLVMAALRRLEFLANQEKKCSSIDQLLLDSIQIELEPRLTKKEAELFQEGAAKVFNLSTTSLNYNKLSVEKVRTEIERIDKKFSNKIARLVLNLQEQLSTRTGVMILGQSGVGKSTIWRISQRLLGDSLVKYMVISPRSCQKKELFGFVDPSSNKWVDGLLTLKVREATSILQSDSNTVSVKQVWIILDGPVDPDWIESLNSVLDDNQVLTLSSGERLHFYLASGKSIKLIFETTSIDFASPATMSRLGLLYLEDSLTRNCNAEDNLGAYEEQMKIFNNHLIAQNNAKILAKSNLIEEFERNKSSKIIILAGGTNDRTKLGFIEKNLNRDEFTEYSCSPYTNSTHFQDLLSKSRNYQYLLIKGIQITLAEDKQWNTSTFLELLRFMVTYDGYYDAEFNFQPLIHKFILFLDDLTELDPRILALSTAIQLAEGDQIQDVELIDTTLGEFFLSQISNSKSPVSTLSIDLASDDKGSFFDRDGGIKLYEFSNSRLANDSLDALNQILIDQTHKNRSQDHKIFILKELELRLFDERQKSALFHLLNKLKTSRLKSRINFLYIINNFTPESSNHFNFFSSIGPVYKLNDNKSTNVTELICKYTASGNTLKFDSIQQNWIAELLSTFFLQHKVSSLDNFLKFFISLFDRFETDLSNERKTLSSGLSNLNQFERVVNNIKTNCKAEEYQLAQKRKEIDRLMKLLDSELKEAHQKREYIDELKNKQVIKTKEIDLNSKSIKEKLSKVEPLIESSKIEIAKYLKPEALNEIKSLRSPPKTIKDILDVLFVLLGIKDSSWASIKAYLTKYSIKDELTNYDFQKNLNKPLLSEVELIMKTKQGSFNRQQAERASKAIVPILGWIEATLEYGRVLFSLRPLNEELANLKNESEFLNKEAQKIEVETTEVNEKIQDYSSKLEKLKQELEESQKKANLIDEQLTRAQKVRIEMEDRIEKWRFRSETLELLLKSDKLIKLCLIASTLVFEYNSNLEELFKFFELEGFTTEKFIVLFMNLIKKEREFNEFSIKPEQTKRIVQLLLIKLCLDDNSGIINIPFINTGSQSEDKNTFMDKVVLFLCCENIIFDPKKLFILRSQGESSDWLQSIELSRRLNKLILIELQDKPATFHLDIIDLISSMHQASGSNKELNCILIGNLEDEFCDTFKHMLRPIELDESPLEDSLKEDNEFDCSIKSTILERLVNFHDPELSKRVEQLENELSNKHVSAKSMEKDLLKQLASVQSENELSNDLVRILSELYQLSCSLEKDLNEMKVRLNELKSKENQYSKEADKAAYFYKHFIADLFKMDNFYRMSLNSYIGLLVSSSDVDEDNYQVIINKIILSMRCEDRLIFSDKLRNGDQQQQLVDVNVTKLAESSTSQSLKGALSELLIEKKFDTSRMTTITTTAFTYKLAIVMHDPTKSSPQAEIDELFRQPELVVGEKRVACCYSKIYATGESPPKHLDFELRKLSSSYDSGVKKAKSCDDSNNGNCYATKVKCLCIANAHLSADWLNSHLLRLLNTQVEEKSSSTKSSSATKVLALVILVGEKEAKVKVFSEEVLDCAKIRYWHDELTLNLWNRYEQLCCSVLISNKENASFLKTNSTSGTNSQASSEVLLILAKQLILFHVVCQELTKPYCKIDAKTFRTKQDEIVPFKRWKNWQNYNFDYDLLCLAFKTLKFLWEQQSQNGNDNNRKLDMKQFRFMFCNYLKNIIYGSRMESLEDELRLNCLLERFISSSESGEDQLNKLEELKSASGSVIENNRLLATFIDDF